MNKKINPLKNISQKSKKFFQFLNFVLKKIISLQSNKVVFRYICLVSGNFHIFKRYSSTEAQCLQQCGLAYFEYRVVEDFRSGYVSPLF